MTEPATIVVTVDQPIADALEALAARDGLTVSRFVSDQLSRAFVAGMPSRRANGRTRRRASRRRLRALAIANGTQRADKAANPITETSTS